MSTAAHNAIVTLVTFYGAALAEQQQQISELQAKLEAANHALAAAGEQLRLQANRKGVAAMPCEEDQDLLDAWYDWKGINERADIQPDVGTTRCGQVQAEAMGQAGRSDPDADSDDLREVRSGQAGDEQHGPGESCDLSVCQSASASRPLIGRKKGELS